MNLIGENGLIVIGRRLNSALFAYLHEATLLVNGKMYDLPFDFFDPGYSLRTLWMTNIFRYYLNTVNETPDSVGQRLQIINACYPHAVNIIVQRHYICC
jgi:hypothetical protein